MSIQNQLADSRLDSRAIDGGTVATLLSCSPADPAWDDFLDSTPVGRFEQSCRWAQVKATEGFHPARLVLAPNHGFVGGCQILWRRSRLGAFGYMSKGPVLAQEDAEIADTLVEALCGVARTLRLRALIVQPPEFSNALTKALIARRFLPNHIADLITATLVVDLAQGMEKIEKAMSRTTRQKVRQARDRGVVVREGGESDIGRFFQLMLSTCKRQSTEPNPSNEESLHRLWDAFHPSGSVRLSFAEYNSEPLSGLLSIAFGNRVTFWKRGWVSRDDNLHPNELLMYDALKWAQANGYKFADFGSLEREIAMTLLQGKSLSEEQKRSRDFFHLGFGGEPQLLPEGLVYFPSPVLRHLYLKAFSKRFLANAVKRMLR